MLIEIDIHYNIISKYLSIIYYTFPTRVNIMFLNTIINICKVVKLIKM